MYHHLSFQFNSNTEAKLDEYINEQYEIKKPVLPEFVLYRTYSRNKYSLSGEYEGKENKYDITKRVVLGAFSILKRRLQELDKYDSIIESGSQMRNKGNNYKDALQLMALEFFKLIWEDKITPPGRGLWTMGTELINKDCVSLALVNCTFHTSKFIKDIKQEFFAFIMDALMLGIGAGFDVEGENTLLIKMPVSSNFRKYDKYYELINQLREFSKESKFIDANGINYIKREIETVISLTAAHSNYLQVHVIEDSRMGWVNALRELLRSYFDGSYITIFDYSKIRLAGILLKKFGGVASGPIPLCELLTATRCILQKRIGQYLQAIDIIDICNLIARTVIAGNVRRSSEICLFKDNEVLDAKQYSNPKYTYRKMWGWASNNSYVCDEPISKEKTDSILNNVLYNGEPGIFFRHNAKKYGRIVDGENNNDSYIDGQNPCGEISLEGHDYNNENNIINEPYSGGGETCNLVETFPSNFAQLSEVDIPLAEGLDLDKVEEDNREYYDALYYAVLYCKIVTLLPVHWKGTNNIQKRNRRIGVSMSGIHMFLQQIGYDYDYFAKFCDIGYKYIRKYDKEISEMLNIPESIKVTTVKPAGSISLVCNTTSGMHAPISKYYLRRVRYSISNVEWTNLFQAAGYLVEPDLMNPTNTMIVAFPVFVGDNIKTKEDFGIEEQFKLLHILQKYWADNQVSCTIDFTKNEIPLLSDLIMKYQDELKGLSMLPRNECCYAQMPQEKITKEYYDEYVSKLKPINLRLLKLKEEIEEETDNYCSGDSCMFRASSSNRS